LRGFALGLVIFRADLTHRNTVLLAACKFIHNRADYLGVSPRGIMGCFDSFG
jgi:hypothetical protein